MIIGISGKKNSGKDLVGMIIQAIVDKPKCFDNTKDVTEEIIKYKVWDKSTFEVKKFADKLKDIVCLLIGCTREQLEDREFKESPLSKEWEIFWYETETFGNKKLAEDLITAKMKGNIDYGSEILTPRKLLQLMGTECGREIIHPNIWVNSLFSDYVQVADLQLKGRRGNLMYNINQSNWIITDVRFPNEAEAIKRRGGLLLRLESKRCDYTDTHPSETALDDYGGKGNEVRTDRWDKVIFNDGTIDDLIIEVKKFLIKNKII